MTNWIGYLAALSLASLPAAAQDRGGGDRNTAPQQRGNNNQAPPQQRGNSNQAPRASGQVGRGYVPARGPSPVRNSPQQVTRAPATHGEPDPQHHAYRDQPAHPEIPHVHAQGDQWVGHTTGRNDPRYRLEQPWAHGRFTGGFGPRYVYRLRGGNEERFELDGNFFAIAPADYELCNDWDFDDDNIVLYADPDHDGFYLAYDTRLGTYAHVEYLGG
jgi:hypothetical protein